VNTALKPECKLASEESGIIGFVPGTSHIGDLICKIKTSNIFVIVRLIDNAKRAVIVGRILR